MKHQFILHIIISLGIFETELYLKIHKTLRNDLHYAKVIGTNDDKESLKQYSRSRLWCFIEEQLVHIPNLFR